jgi:hypothetical protein
LLGTVSVSKWKVLFPEDLFSPRQIRIKVLAHLRNVGTMKSKFIFCFRTYMQLRLVLFYFLSFKKILGVGEGGPNNVYTCD